MAKSNPKPRPRPTKSKSSSGTTLIAFFAFACIGAAGWMGYEVYKERMADTADMQMVKSASGNVRELHLLAAKALDESPQVISTVRSQRIATDSAMSKLRNSAERFSGVNPDVVQAIRRVGNNWSEIATNLQVIETLKTPLQVRFDTVEQIQSQISALRESNDRISMALASQGGTPAQVYYATRQNQILSDLAANVAEHSDSDAKAQSDLVKRYGQSLGAMLNGSGDTVEQVSQQAIRARLSQNAQLFSEMRGLFESLYSASSQVLRAKKAVQELAPASEELAEQMDTLYSNIDAAVLDREINPQRAGILGIGGFFLLVVFILLSIRTNAERAREANNSKNMIEEGNRRRQEEMQTLITEMHPLTSGDLTTEASQSGVFTKQIAQVFNRIISSLRDIVNRLQLSAMEIASAAEQSHRTSDNLKKLRKRNESVIASSSELAHKMDKSIENIGQHASQTARSSSESAKAVDAGRQSVEKTHRAVEVADTSIRVSADMVKKLGEDIQQIESITITIREITDNLQSLSYNTQLIADRSTGDEQDAISATADKMESLAKTVFGSLEEITHIVTGITGRAAETQTYIEKSRGDFVDLVKNSNTTLLSFEQIGNATNKAHENIRQIEAEAQQLTSTSQRFIDNINEIQALSQESSAATEETTMAISKLTNLASGLKDHASKFRTGKSSGIESV